MPIGVTGTRCFRVLQLSAMNVLQASFPEELSWKLDTTFRADVCKYFKAAVDLCVVKILIWYKNSVSIHIYADCSKFEQGQDVRHSVFKLQSDTDCILRQVFFHRN